MATKTKTVKKTFVKKAVRPIDEKTGYRVGSLGYSIGRAYLGTTKWESAVKAVEAVIKNTAKAKGKPEDYIHGRAVSWVGFLVTNKAKFFKELPKTTKVAEPVKA